MFYGAKAFLSDGSGSSRIPRLRHPVDKNIFFKWKSDNVLSRIWWSGGEPCGSATILILSSHSWVWDELRITYGLIFLCKFSLPVIRLFFGLDRECEKDGGRPGPEGGRQEPPAVCWKLLLILLVLCQDGSGTFCQVDKTFAENVFHFGPHENQVFKKSGE